MRAALALSGLILAAASPGLASTSSAWREMNQRVHRACLAASGLTRPRLIGTPVSFSDPIGTEIRMLQGLRRGRPKRLLCAYNRRTRAVEVQDAPAWTATRP